MFSSPFLLRLVDDLPQLLRCEWHINMRYTQRIGNSVSNCRGRPDSASLTDTFHPKRIDGSRRDGGIKLEAGKLRGEWHCIVHQRGRQQLTILTVDGPFPHRLANALGNTPMKLSLYNHRVDLATTVVNSHIARNLRFTGLLVYLDNTDMRAKGEDTIFWLPENRRLQSRLDTWSQCIGDIRRCGHFSKGHCFLRGAGHEEVTILQRDI